VYFYRQATRKKKNESSSVAWHTTYLVALDEPLSKLLLNVPSTNPGEDHRRVFRQNVLSIKRGIQIPLREKELQLVVGDGEIPVEEQHALDAASPDTTPPLDKCAHQRSYKDSSKL